MDWHVMLAGFVNTTATWLIVQLAKTYVPRLRARAPALLPVLAGALGPAVAWAQTALAAWLGAPVDLSPILGIFTGAAAVAVNQLCKRSTAPGSRLRRLVG